MDREGRNCDKLEIPGSWQSMRGYNIFWPTPGFKGSTFAISGFSTEGALFSASSERHCGVLISYSEGIIVKWVIHDSMYAVLYICLRTHASLHVCTVGLCVGDSFEFHIVSVVVVFVLHRQGDALASYVLYWALSVLLMKYWRRNKVLRFSWWSNIPSVRPGYVSVELAGKQVSKTRNTWALFARVSWLNTVPDDCLLSYKQNDCGCNTSLA